MRNPKRCTDPTDDMRGVKNLEYNIYTLNQLRKKLNKYEQQNLTKSAENTRVDELRIISRQIGMKNYAHLQNETKSDIAEKIEWLRLNIEVMGGIGIELGLVSNEPNSNGHFLFAKPYNEFGARNLPECIEWAYNILEIIGLPFEKSPEYLFMENYTGEICS